MAELHLCAFAVAMNSVNLGFFMRTEYSGGTSSGTKGNWDDGDVRELLLLFRNREQMSYFLI